MNKARLKTLIVNFSFLSGGEILCKIATFAAFVYLARILGPKSFGYLEFTIAITFVFTLLIDLGTGPYGAREIAKDKSRIREILPSIMVIRVGLALIGYSILAAIAWFLSDKAPIKDLLLIYGLSLFAIPGYMQWVFQGIEKMQWVALGSVLRQFTFAIGVFLFVRGSEEIQLIAIIECIAVFTVVLIHWVIFKYQIQQFSPGLGLGLGLGLDLQLIKYSLGQALPIGLSELTWAFTWYFATIFLGFIAASDVVGWFASAHRPVLALHTFVWLYFFNLLPSMSRCIDRPIDEFKALVTTSIRFTAWPAVFIGISGALMASPAILILFGENYANSIDVFQILILMIPVSLLSGHYRYALIAFNLQKYEFLSALFSAITCLFSVYWLSSRYGAIGAAFGLLSTQIINLILAYLYTRKMIAKIGLLWHLVKPLLCGAAMVIIYTVLVPTNQWLAYSVSAAVFLILMLLVEPDVKTIINRKHA